MGLVWPWDPLAHFALGIRNHTWLFEETAWKEGQDAPLPLSASSKT